jgi:peptidoglycan/LPS O-acetylase OafA/YrhL
METLGMWVPYYLWPFVIYAASMYVILMETNTSKRWLNNLQVELVTSLTLAVIVYLFISTMVNYQSRVANDELENVDEDYDPNANDRLDYDMIHQKIQTS